MIWIGKNRSEISLYYSNIFTASIRAIQNRLLVLDNQERAKRFDEFTLGLLPWMDGARLPTNYYSGILLIVASGLYAAFLLWLTSELFEELR
ncbi:MAG: DUF853 family protein [Rhodobacteraceae bacterium]|nr:DUF853 family protein [Paracoccaceae bacterium]